MPEVILNGPEGRIECMYSQGKENGCPVALILHPEPYQGGSMNNKVTYSLYQEFYLEYLPPILQVSFPHKFSHNDRFEPF